MICMMLPQFRVPSQFSKIVFSPLPKLPPMNRCRLDCQMNPLTGIWPACGDAISYRYASPDGDAGHNNQHLGAHHVSAATPPRCDDATTILHSPFLILNWTHTFSAKERDAETGLSYFGSRYYSSDLSIWLSVDPMSDKYPHQSNYVYCSNNPIKVIDPNGEDEYEFDGEGNLNWVRPSDFDSFHKVDENGRRTGESCQFEGIVVSNQFNLGKKHVSSYLQINNSQDAMDLFSFISDNVENDGAEFSISLVQDKNGDVYNLIGSDKNAKAGETYSIPNLFNCDDYTVLKTAHNHYAGKKSPSGSDVDYAKKFPNTIFMIRTAGDVFTPYDKNTTPDYDFGTPDVVIPLKPVVIPIKKN